MVLTYTPNFCGRKSRMTCLQSEIAALMDPVVARSHAPLKAGHDRKAGTPQRIPTTKNPCLVIGADQLNCHVSWFCVIWGSRNSWGIHTDMIGNQTWQKQKNWLRCWCVALLTFRKRLEQECIKACYRSHWTACSGCGSPKENQGSTILQIRDYG